MNCRKYKARIKAISIQFISILSHPTSNSYHNTCLHTNKSLYIYHLPILAHLKRNFLDMLNYKEAFELMQHQFYHQNSMTDQTKTGVTISYLPFESKFGKSTISIEPNNQQESIIDENIRFQIPVVAPINTNQFSKGIVLFHGLNERAWDKYLVWAQYLCLKTGKPVILFPIAYHMNRSPKSWSDPRSMSQLAAKRRTLPSNGQCTFANAALSSRLEANPEQMFISGVQSYYDVIQLISEIHDGRHKLFSPEFEFDIFSYSIGAFLSEILILNNPKNLFSKSKLFMFCGGSTFDFMQGVSKLIMDQLAYLGLLTFQHRANVRKLYKGLKQIDKKGIGELWGGIKAMLNQKTGRRIREKRLRALGERVYAVTLRNDQVIPSEAILNTLRGKKQNLPPLVEVLDFQYKYSHEQPFPFLTGHEEQIVNQSFCMVFDRASHFLR